MIDLDNFYNSILNIVDKDRFDEIKRIVIEEREKVLKEVHDVLGLCKYLANVIEVNIHNNLSGVWVNKLDLNDLFLVDHVVLIVEYKYNNAIKRLLIDPTFMQFVKDDNQKLSKLNKWPSDLLDKEFVDTLLKDGLIEIDNISFNKYLRAFGYKDELDLNELLLKENLNKLK